MNLLATMSSRFALFPQSASSSARTVDHLFAYLTFVSLFFILLVLVLIVTFAIRYRRSAPPGRYQPVMPTHVPLEILWTVMPLVLALVAFAWGAELYVRDSGAPADATEVSVLARQWMWTLQYPDGRAEMNELHVPVGRTTRLTMVSEDVIHSFYLPAFRVKQDVLPGRYSTLAFTPNQAGRYDLFCAEYCGTNHSQMIGTVVAMEPSHYLEWLSGGGANEPLAIQGQRLFERFACHTCHVPGDSQTESRCPDLHGVYGSIVTLDSGVMVEASEGYIRQSIYDPKARIVRGYEPIMPSFQGQVSEEDMFKLLAYIKSIGLNNTTTQKVAP